jgi:peptidoglycan/xylan/chitin deacetylase (PgdA/CDA1 family)
MFTKVVHRALRMPEGYPGYRRWLRQARSRSVAIVMYHGVTSKPLPIANWCQLAADQFEEQMRFLSHEYTVLAFSDVVTRLTRGAVLPERAACITFDDGFRNVSTTAFPILQRYQLPATVFLVTSLIGKDSPAWPELIYHAVLSTARPSVDFDGREWLLTSAAQRAAAYTTFTAQLKKLPSREKDERMAELFHALGPVPAIERDSALAVMDWGEIERLSATGLVTFGSHTHTHPILSQCTEEMQCEELRVSRQILLDRLGTADLFAYPNGTRADFTARTKRLLMELGYVCGASTIPGLNNRKADLYALQRINVGADLRWSQFELAMAGV